MDPDLRSIRKDRRKNVNRRTTTIKPHFNLFYLITFHGVLRTLLLVLCIINFILVESVTDTFILKYLVQYTGIYVILFLFIYLTIYLMSIAHSQPNIRWIFQEMIGIGVGLFFFVDSTLIMLFCSIQWGHFAWICSTITSSICTVLLAVDFYVMSKKHHENPEITTTDSLAIKC